MSTTPLHHTGLSADTASRLPESTPAGQPDYTPITGGRKVAALTAVGLVAVMVVGLLPIVGSLFQ
ncbi:hypothetical protein ACPEEZ_13480 [Frigoribacterium sp. 2-23]|uniref:hypothetical protein n=1 Tax=Frigoribacterium sp. 2-23 TaxID=3415006 RepID=UPI003C701115